MNKKDMFIREKLQQDKVISDRANKIFDNIKEEFKMENNEKKVIKISFGTFLAIAASLVIVGFVGINLYANSLGKPNIISRIKALIKNETEVNVDEIAKELFEKAMLAIRDPYKYYEGTDNEVEEIQGKYYREANSTYNEVKLKYGEIFTDEALKNVLDFNFYNKDGILYALERAAGTPWQIVELNVEKINEEDEELTYNAIYKLSYTDDPVGKEPKEEKCQFKIKKVDGEYRISATNFYNLDEEVQDDTTNNYLDNETAKSIIRSYLNIFGAKQGSPAGALMLEEIRLLDSYSEIPGGDYIDNQNYRSSNIKYDEFKNIMLGYMTEEALEELSVYGYKNVNGMLYIFDGGASGMTFDLKEIRLISSNGNNLEYEIEGIVYSPGQGYDFTGEAQLQKNKNNKYVVSKLEWRELDDDITENEKTEIEGYISKIYPLPAMNCTTFPEFDTIEEVKDEEWVWSTTIVEASGVELLKGGQSATLNEINKSAKKLFGNDIGEFPINKLESLNIIKEDDVYTWIGCNGSIPEVAKYRIKSITKEDSIYNVEIAEYIIYDWADGIRILDVQGNIIKVISNDDTFPYNEAQKIIEQYVNDNIDNLNSKLLKIGFDETNSQYRIISSKLIK